MSRSYKRNNREEGFPLEREAYYRSQRRASKNKDSRYSPKKPKHQERLDD